MCSPAMGAPKRRPNGYFVTGKAPGQWAGGNGGNGASHKSVRHEGQEPRRRTVRKGKRFHLVESRQGSAAIFASGES